MLPSEKGVFYFVQHGWIIHPTLMKKQELYCGSPVEEGRYGACKPHTDLSPRAIFASQVGVETALMPSKPSKSLTFCQ